MLQKWIERKPKSNINKGSDLLSKLANIRGVPVSEVDEFLFPSADVLISATDMKNAVVGAERIMQAIDNDENIVVSGDNDADGVTSTAIIVRYLQERMGKEIPYIYAQRDWGHGIKEQLRTKGDELEDEDRNENARHNQKMVMQADLLIIVDSSSNDVDTCEKIIDEWGTDILILDHHGIDNPDKTMKDAGAILVNPQQKGDRYINKSISGAGVVWKVVGLVEELYDDGLIDTDKYIDLVAVGIYSDVMSMDIPENRYIVSQGLLNINNMGLERIIKSGNNSKTDGLTGDIIGFTVAPLLNGTARMGNIQDAIALLLSDEDKEVKRIRLRMHKANEQRKILQKEMAEKLTQNIDASNQMIFIVTDDSNKGMNGLVAQEISQKYKRHVFIGTDKNGMIMGSVRTFGNFELKTFFQDSGLVEFASGHEGAFGLGFKSSQRELIESYAIENLPAVKMKDNFSMYDVYLDAEEAEEAIDLIESFNHITGTNCRKIIVRIDDLMVDERRILGDNRNTIKFSTMDDISLIKFRVDEEYANEVSVMDTISVVGELKWNIWVQFRPEYIVHKTMQVIIEDYKSEV